MENTNTQSEKESVGEGVKILPVGLMQKEFHEKFVKEERFNEVCGAISRYYNAGMKINIEWVQEYNELVEQLFKNDEQKLMI